MKILTPSHPVAPLVAAYNDFGFRLFTQLAQPAADQNIFISPFSIAVALTMTTNGAAHETQKAMLDALGLSGLSLAEVNTEAAALLTSLENPDPHVQLASANSLWATPSLVFRPPFIERNQNFYRAEVRAIDFTAPDAAATINAWVKDQTRDKIDRLVQPSDLSALTTLILINALYFQGKWTRPFDTERTKMLPFSLLDGTTRQHPLMSQAGEYDYYEDESMQAVRLPYGAGRVGMYVVLPKPENALANLPVRLAQQNWQHWRARFESQPGSILLPRFKLEYGQELKQALIAMSMGLAFSPEADFSQISDVPSWIDKVIHKTFVELNEEGTEAAAATAVVMVRGMPPKDRFHLRVDRPFFCAIVDNQTGVILFMGSIVDPRSA
jgi:serine protease inhibitor